MSLNLIITSIAFILFLVTFVMYLLKKDKISIKYSLVWLLPSIILFIFVIIPGVLNKVTELLGFQTASNMIFALLISLLLIVNLSLTVIVSKQKEQIKLLIQEVSLLKEKK